jgi:hypothetical protein
MSDSDTITRALKDIEILVDVSERALSHYERYAHLIDNTVIVNQRKTVEYYRAMLRAKEEVINYNKDEHATSEK